MLKKRTILTQEGLRRLRNTKIELGTEVQELHINTFMLKLKNSGYNFKFRTEVLEKKKVNSVLYKHKITDHKMKQFNSEWKLQKNVTTR